MPAEYAELASRAAAVALLTFFNLCKRSAPARAFPATGAWEGFWEGFVFVNGLGPPDALPLTVAAVSGSTSPRPPGGIPLAGTVADVAAVLPGCGVAVVLGTAAVPAAAAAATASAVAAGSTPLPISTELEPAPAVSLVPAPAPPPEFSAAAPSVPVPLAFWFRFADAVALEAKASFGCAPSGVVAPGAFYI
jgi:hypothetical protein